MLRRWAFTAFVILLAACNLPTVTPEATATPGMITLPTATALLTETAHPTPTATPTSSPSPTPFPDPEGCLRPPDDYTRVVVNGHTLNRRTYLMLQHAAEMYAGVIDVAGLAITQGSYVDGEPLSFGTHSGGGAVDISVISRERWQVLYDEIPPLIEALRIAGFAAWLRDPGELAPGSPIHIHAVAIGDAELSPAAQDQLIGPYGYLRGYNGLPLEYGGPAPDPHGGPLVCWWMVEMGYRDLRAETP